MIKRLIKYKMIFPLCVMITSLLFAACQQREGGGETHVMGTKTNQQVAPRVGYIAPNFTLRDINGNQVSLSDFKGQVVMLNFWATWCGPCKMEMPSMEDLQQELQGKNFKMLAIANDDEGESIVKPYIEQGGYSFQVLVDNTFTANDAYNITSIPTTVLIDQEGIITNKLFGARNWTHPSYKDLILNLIKSDTRQHA